MTKDPSSEREATTGTPDQPLPPSSDDGRERTSPPEDQRRDRVAALEAENTLLTDRLLRLAAEFENWKKRAAREQGDAGRREREEVLYAMLEVVDGLERALAALLDKPDTRAVREGVGLVLRNLLERLEGYGIEPVSAVGEEFDPRLHDAIARAPSRDVEPGTVLSEVQKGYIVEGRLLRPASVVVAETSEPPAHAPRS